MTMRTIVDLARGGASASLLIREEALGGQAPEDVMVAVAAQVLDREIMEGRAVETASLGLVGSVTSAGTSQTFRSGQRVVGVGPAADQVALAGNALLAVPSDLPLEPEMIPLLPAIASILSAVRALELAPGESVGVSGSGLSARLTEWVLAALAALVYTLPPWPGRQDLSAAGPPVPAAAQVDVLIDATANPERWIRVFPLVRDQGKVLLLVPPGRQVVPFEFYPQIHRRSLCLFVRRVPALDWARIVREEGAFLTSLLARHPLVPADLLTEVAVASGSSGGAIPLTGMGDRPGMLIRWPAAAALTREINSGGPPGVG